MAPHRRVPIGRYFERLVEAWLRAAKVEKLAANTPIRDGGTTLGELDLVFETHGQAVHWELAVKFYLGLGDLSKACSWHGPRARDRLDKKLTTMYERQLRLPTLAKTQEHLRSLGFESVTSQSFAKGYLFYPHECFVDDASCGPEEAGSEHLRGWWLYERHWEELLALHPGGFRCLPKCEWLAPAAGQADVPRENLRARIQAALAEAGPTMFAAIDRESREVSRGFVVPNDWAPDPS